MTMTHSSRRMVAVLLSMSLIWLGLFSSLTQADLISTQEMQSQLDQKYNKQQLQDLLSKAEVQEQLITLGVDIDTAKERVNQLTIEEISLLNEQIDELPAGSGILDLIVLFLLVFIITDVIGATDIFPFIKPVNTK